MPTVADLRASVRERLAAALAERQTHTDRLTEMRAKLEAGDATVTEDAVRGVLAERSAVDATIEQLKARDAELDAEQRADDAADSLQREIHPGAARPAYDKVARVSSEPRTYTEIKSKRGEASFFSDSYRAEFRQDFKARERLERHMVEVEREGEMSERAVATGGAAGLVVPQYLVDLNAPVLRSGRPFANICNGHELPSEGMSLIIPRGTTGASAASQATENAAVSNTDEVWANLTVPVVTIAGQQQLSRQLLERGTPGIDAIVYGDLARAYHAELDRQALAGSGASNQMLGVQNTSGIGAATAFGAAPTVTNFNLKLAGQQFSVAAAGAGIMARAIVMHPRRWSWLLGQVDSTGRPVVSATAVGNFNALSIITEPGAYSGDKGGVDPMQSFFVGMHSSGLPVLTDLNVPANVGTNVEDLVFVVDNHEMHLWEDGDGNPRELRFEQTLGSALTTTLVIYGYAGFTAGRYPLAAGKIGGLDTVATQGLVAPSF